MCYSVRASLSAWVVSILIAIYLWRRNNSIDRWNASFIITFSVVQLWEAGIWGTENKELFVKLIAITLALQPLVQTVGAWQWSGDSRLQLLITFYAIIVVYTIYRVMTETFDVTVGPNGHLVWSRNVFGPTMLIITYILGLFIGLFWGLPKTIPLMVIGLGTLAWSMSRVSTGEVGSYWCYIAVIYSVCALII